jgi:hypothetical protein
MAGGSKIRMNGSFDLDQTFPLPTLDPQARWEEHLCYQPGRGAAGALKEGLQACLSARPNREMARRGRQRFRLLDRSVNIEEIPGRGGYENHGT